MLQHADTPAKPSFLTRAISVVVAVWVAYISFRLLWVFTRPGIDPAWEWAINHAGADTFVFGRDFIWMWGPLGFLFMAQAVGHHLLLNACMAFGMHAIFVGCLLYRAWRAEHVAPVLLFALGYGSSLALGLLAEHPLIAIFALLCTIALEAERERALRLAAVLAAVIVFVKLSAGVVSIAFVGLVHLVQLLERRRHAWRDIGTSIGLFSASCAMLACVLFARWDDWRQWFVLSFDIVSGYDEAISLIGPAQELWAALALIGLIAGAMAWAWHARLASSAPMLVGAFGLFASFKHGFIRHDSPHFRSFSCGALIITAVWALNAKKRADILLCGGLVVAAVIVAFAAEAHLVLNREHIKTMLSGAQATDALKRATHPEASKAWLEMVGREQVAPYKLAPDWLEAVANGSQGRLTPLPIEMAWCSANAVRCAPVPTLQLLVSYTDKLDAANAAFIDATLADPTSILLEYTAIDAHHMLYEAPLFWQRVLAQFAVVKRDSAKLLLQRRKTPWSAASTPIQTVAARLGEWQNVPKAEHLVFAQIEVARSLQGKIAATIYKMPPLYIEVRLSSGDVMQHRFIRRLGPNGLLGNVYVKSLQDTEALFAGRAQSRIEAVRIVPEHNRMRYFRKDMSITWQRSGLPVVFDTP